MKFIVSKINFVFPIVTITALLQFCAPAMTTTSSPSGFEEDLSIYRPDYEEEAPTEGVMVTATPKAIDLPYIEPTNAIKSELDTVLMRIKNSKAHIGYIDGYAIQLYSGNNRDKANQIKARSYEVLEEKRPRVSYDQPNYKVRVGEYYSRIEANSDFVHLQRHFSRAVLVPVKIKIE